MTSIFLKKNSECVKISIEKLRMILQKKKKKIEEKKLVEMPVDR
jgi:hypothetical protein